jgi:hypothetical protein
VIADLLQAREDAAKLAAKLRLGQSSCPCGCGTWFSFGAFAKLVGERRS